MYQLMDHQAQAVNLSRFKDRHLFAFDTGTGKTLISLEIIKDKSIKTLVVCPLSIIEAAWMRDMQQFHPSMKAINLWKALKSSKFSYDELKKYDVVIINFESFKTQAERLSKCGFQMVIIDESSKVKQVKSQITKAITLFCKQVPFVYLFSGTPAPNSELEWFSQSRIVNESIFGPSYYRFRAQYFFACGYNGYQWKLPEHKRTALLDGIAKISTTVRKEDVLDLPERTDNIRSVFLNADEKKAYKEMKNNLIIEIDEGIITASNAAVKIMKLRQITSGFLIDEEKLIHGIGSSKLNELMELLDEIGSSQAIIWTQFLHEATTLAKALDGKAGVINGTVKQEDRDEIITRFRTGSLQYIIAHPKSMGHGITLTECSYAIYYSLDYSHEGHYQSRDRIYRYGQKNKCSYYYLLAEKSIDEVIYKALQTKADIEAAVINYIRGRG